MKKITPIVELVGQQLSMVNASGGMLALVFGEKFTILVPENPDPDFEPMRISELAASDVLDFGEGALIASSIATDREIFAARLDREEARRKASAEWRARQDAAEREQYERLRQKFGST